MNVNWGILATGKIAHKFADDFRSVKNGQIVAVASRTQKNADDFAKQYNIQTAYDNYEKLVNDKNVDIIYIAAPHNLHFESALLCLTHNKAVLCEKPFTVNTPQLQHLIKIAKERDIFLMEALWTYFIPAVLKAIEWTNTGKIGEILGIQATFGFKAPYNPSGRLFNLNYAGGSLLDVGVYGIAFSELILNTAITEIAAKAVIGKTGVDEYTTIILKHQNGIITQLTSSLIADLNNDGFIFGTKGSIHLPLFWRASRAILNTPAGTEVFEEPRTTHGYNYMATAVNRLLLTGAKESNIATLARSLKNMTTMDKIRDIIGLKYPMECKIPNEQNP